MPRSTYACQLSSNPSRDPVSLLVAVLFGAHEPILDCSVYRIKCTYTVTLPSLSLPASIEAAANTEPDNDSWGVL